ncbi:uncharacterized protein G2W53_037165 [Senna tora]|uniref:Uncharacterized protein n=1 Tax=Senna tora TaxID=362788 RepID=A0A834SYQ9_9FABA|nr:uncharacterized protein G2W53_037165 [Senna tora]
MNDMNAKVKSGHDLSIEPSNKPKEAEEKLDKGKRSKKAPQMGRGLRDEVSPVHIQPCVPGSQAWKSF